MNELCRMGGGSHSIRPNFRSMTPSVDLCAPIDRTAPLLLIEGLDGANPGGGGGAGVGWAARRDTGCEREDL